MFQRNEKEMIMEWAGENSADNIKNLYLPASDDSCQSYWQECDGLNNIEEYEFRTVYELENKIKGQLSGKMFESLIPVLVVASFKERKDFGELKDEVCTKKSDTNDGFEIPEFNYAF